MGMAASQARLLCITARIHDVEYQAQSIQNAKTQLATLSDAAYQEYLRELDDTTLTINSLDANGENKRIIATFKGCVIYSSLEYLNMPLYISLA